jgi:hypothetical protein
MSVPYVRIAEPSVFYDERYANTASLLGCRPAGSSLLARKSEVHSSKIVLPPEDSDDSSQCQARRDAVPASRMQVLARRRRLNATVDSLGLSVCAPSFEAAKHDIELTLGKHIEALLGQNSSAHRAHAA